MVFFWLTPQPDQKRFFKERAKYVGVKARLAGGSCENESLARASAGRLLSCICSSSPAPTSPWTEVKLHPISSQCQPKPCSGIFSQSCPVCSVFPMSAVVPADVELGQEDFSQEVEACLRSHGRVFGDRKVHRALQRNECFHPGRLPIPVLSPLPLGIQASRPKCRPKRGNFKPLAKLLKRASERTGGASRRITSGTSVRMQRTTDMAARLPSAIQSQGKRLKLNPF